MTTNNNQARKNTALTNLGPHMFGEIIKHLKKAELVSLLATSKNLRNLTKEARKNNVKNLEDSATKIQKTFKGHQTRRNLKRKLESEIQAFIRNKNLPPSVTAKLQKHLTARSDIVKHYINFETIKKQYENSIQLESEIRAFIRNKNKNLPQKIKNNLERQLQSMKKYPHYVQSLRTQFETTKKQHENSIQLESEIRAFIRNQTLSSKLKNNLEKLLQSMKNYPHTVKFYREQFETKTCHLK
jgi:flagellar motor component MotA